MAHHGRYTVWDPDQECWVLYKNGKFIGGDAIDAFGELEDTGATPFDIRRMQRIAKEAETHGGIYHLAALDDAAMEDRLIILPDGITEEMVRPIFQLYAPDIYYEIWGKYETPKKKAERKILKNVESDFEDECSSSCLGTVHQPSEDELIIQNEQRTEIPVTETPQQQKGKDESWKDPIKAFDGW